MRAINHQTDNITDDEIIAYRGDLDEPHLSSIRIEFADISTLTSTLRFVVEGLARERIRFLYAVRHACSSDGIHHAHNFRILAKLKTDILANMREAGVTEEDIAIKLRWAEVMSDI